MIFPDWLPTGLSPVVARLARADDCIAEMADLSGAWSLDAVELTQLRRRDGRFRTVVSAVRPIPPVVSLLFSEGINHLRAVLDNVVWHLVCEQTATPLDDRVARDVAMPIYDDVDKFADWTKRVGRRVPELGKEDSDTYQRVRALQPFVDKARIASMSPTLAVLTDVEPEMVHPLLLLQAYSNLDKHRAISVMVGRMMTTASGIPFMEQDRSFREMGVGAVVSPDGTWGTPVPVESHAAVMVERPAPWSAAVSPATEMRHLRDWVREQALPWLVTGAVDVASPVPVTIPLDDDGRTLHERIAKPDRESGLERITAVNAQRFTQAMLRPPKFPPVVDTEFDDLP